MIRKLFICVVLCALLCAGGTIRAYAEELHSEVYRAVQSEFELLQDTYTICDRYPADPEIILAIMWHESRLQPDIPDSPTHDRGLMQINEIHWDYLLNDYGLDVSDPVQNIEAGVLIYSQLLDKYPQEDALAAYARGEAGMLRGEGYDTAKEFLEIMYQPK